MRIGVPRERMVREGRVGLIPSAAAELIKHGHEILVEADAGQQSGYGDDAYRTVGARIVSEAPALYEGAELIVKVKQPGDVDLQYLTKNHLLFCYLHLAADKALMERLQDIGLTAIAFETVQEADNTLPLLAPMSDIAGRVSVQVAAHLLHGSQGGKGLLLGGLPGAERGRVVIIGAGNAGGNAARVAASLGAEVVVFDRARSRMERMRALGDNVTGLYPYHDRVDQEVRRADLLVGAVLIPGRRAPHVVAAETISGMQRGSVVVDISVDQGGCIETTRPTDYSDPVYEWEGVLHFCVTNIPGAVPRSASQALSAALIPYLLQLTQKGWQDNAALSAGVNVRRGKVVHPALKS